MGRACSSHGEKIYVYRVLVWQSEGYHLEDLGVNWRIILKWAISKYWEGVDWINVAEDMDKLWAVVNSVMNLQFTWNDLHKTEEQKDWSNLWWQSMVYSGALLEKFASSGVLVLIKKNARTKYYIISGYLQ